MCWKKQVAQRFFAQQRDDSVPHSKQEPVIGLRGLPTTRKSIRCPRLHDTNNIMFISTIACRVCFVSSFQAAVMKKKLAHDVSQTPCFL